MSGVSIIRAMLAAYVPATTLVPAARIHAGPVPQGAVLPAIGVSSIGSNEIPTVARLRAKRTYRERVQVTVHALSYPQQNDVLKACSLGVGTHSDEVLGYTVLSVIPIGIGPDIPAGDDKIFERSRDFMVTYVEAS